MGCEHIHFVTGRLAERALRREVESVAARLGCAHSIDVLPITVAALMTPAWIAKHWSVPAAATRVILPGYCGGDLSPLTSQVGIPVECGPRDLRQLFEFFGQADPRKAEYGRHDITIVAEINHAPRQSLAQILAQARKLVADGADLIDVGCDPGTTWMGVADTVRALRDEGMRVSIDSFNPTEVAAAVRAGAELVLSVNSTNREAARDWGCEVIVIPDDIPTLGGLDETIEYLALHQVPMRIDPILEPIGCGFAASLSRYDLVRRRYPDVEMLMGIGNLTELTDVDSSGVNVLLLGFCQELGIRAVLTTQVINWARTSVRECDLARRLVHYAVRHHIPPKHIEPGLVTLRDTKLFMHGADWFEQLATQLKDMNYRLFAEGGELHLIASGLHLHDVDPFQLFDQLRAREPRNLTASHAFYLGYELAKANLALQLGKQYQQDEALSFGYLTVPETSHRLQQRAAARTETTE